MKKQLTIYYTSDVHGYFSPIDYASGNEIPSGLANCISNFEKDGNTLIIDGGDILQGSRSPIISTISVRTMAVCPQR